MYQYSIMSVLLGKKLIFNKIPPLHPPPDTCLTVSSPGTNLAEAELEVVTLVCEVAVVLVAAVEASSARDSFTFHAS